MYDPYYREFYQKAIVPIGVNDRFALHESNGKLSHWLIALEGLPSSPESEFYHWKVSIYPSDADGSFDCKQPAHCSPMHECFDAAIETARSFEAYSKNDEIYSVFIQEKIS